MTFFALEQLGKLYDGYQKPFSVAGHQLLLLQLDGERYLIENRCPHMDVPLDRGQLLGSSGIRCRAHGIEFDLVSGKSKGPLADTIGCLKKYPIVYQGTCIGTEL
ncbi:MAG: Rieske (2Fe-2S) protein [Cellvibrionaceae bacterium]|nr:Rieske (2Fe-2S) protein [Cellvibrionaceae bacterium]